MIGFTLLLPASNTIKPSEHTKSCKNLSYIERLTYLTESLFSGIRDYWTLAIQFFFR